MDTLFFVGKTTSGNHHVGASRAIGLVKERECHRGPCVCFRSVQFDEPKHLKHLSTWEAWDGCDFILCLCYYK